MAERDDWNRSVIEEFRANGGKVEQFKTVPLLLLHHVGAKTGTARVNPLAYQAVGDGFAIFASKGGAPDNPDWYYNLRAHPEVSVELGTEEVPVVARILEGEEREKVWSAQKAAVPGFAEYEAKAGREIPVVLLERA